MKNKIILFVLLSLLRGIARMPFWMLYGISNVISFVLQHVIHYRREVITNNLRRSFPEKSQKERDKIVVQYYQHLGDCIVEIVKLLHISDKQLEEHIRVEGTDVIDRLASDGRSIIIFLGHYGNWEWVQEVTRHYDRPSLNAELYRPPKDPVADEIMNQIRARFDTMLIPQKTAVRTLLKLNKEGKQFLVGFIADQRPNSQNLHHWTTFLNQDTAYATGGEEIGTHLNAHFVYLDIEKPSRGHYIMTFQEMTVDENDRQENPYTRLFLQRMEQTIRRAPAYWLWSHNRWEFDREGNVIQRK